VCLTANRRELTRRAVECFKAQTYPNKRLLIWDTGELNDDFDNCEDGDATIAHVPAEAYREPKPTIGALRNEANAFWNAYPIIVHWDSDDWSHPNRIAEQVALLQASGADCVGMNEMLFWRTPQTITNPALMSTEALECGAGAEYREGEAWLYTGTRGGVPALGTSLCYWRKTWERHHFANETQGVEDHWLREKNVVGVSSLFAPGKDPTFQDPRMIARIHGGNTSNGYDLEKHVAQGSREWKRVPEWDARVRELLA
jgi:hypothetical protein